MNKPTRKEYQKIHKWLIKIFGKAYRCESPTCKKISNHFEWALIKGKSYEFRRDNYFMLCRSCHMKYDETKEVIFKKVSWHIGRRHSEKTKILMSKIAKEKHRKPPPKTKEQIDLLRK